MKVVEFKMERFCCKFCESPLSRCVCLERVEAWPLADLLFKMFGDCSGATGISNG